MLWRRGILVAGAAFASRLNGPCARNAVLRAYSALADKKFVLIGLDSKRIGVFDRICEIEEIAERDRLHLQRVKETDETDIYKLVSAESIREQQARLQREKEDADKVKKLMGAASEIKIAAGINERDLLLKVKKIVELNAKGKYVKVSLSGKKRSPESLADLFDRLRAHPMLGAKLSKTHAPSRAANVHVLFIASESPPCAE